MADDRITIGIDIEGKADVEIKRLEKSISSFATEGQKSLGKFQGAFNSFIGNLGANIVTGAFNKVTSAASGLFRTLVVDGVRAAQEQESAVNDLNAALQTAGTFSVEASQDIQEFANTLQATTTIGDEAVLQGVALAQSFVRTADEAKALTAAALDFAKGADLNFTEAIRRLGRGVQGSAADIANFAPEIRNLTKEQLAAGEATRIIAERFRGAAAAETRTFQGAVTQLKNLFGDLTESIGNAVVKNESFTRVVQAVTKAVGEAKDFIDANAQSINDAFSIALQNAIGVAKLFVGALDAIVKGIGGAVNGIVALVAEGFAKATGFFAKFSSSFKQVAKDAQLLSKVAFQEFEKSVSDGVLAKTVKTLNELESAAAKGFGRVVQGAQESTNALRESSQQTTVNAEQARKLFEEQSRLITEQAERQIELDALIAQQDGVSQAERLKNTEDTLKKVLELETLTVRDRERLQKRLTQTQIAQDQLRLKAGSDSLNQLATLQNAKTKELAVLGKGAAIAQTTIDTYRGAQAAAASLAGIPVVGPALAAAAAAAFITAGLARVAQIAGTPLESGMTEVPAGFANDTFPARLSTGERVVDAGTNQDLKAFLSNSRTDDLLGVIAQRLSNLEQRVVVNVGGENLVDVVQRGLERGRVLTV